MKHLRIFEEHIPGGRAAGKSLKDLAKAHGVNPKSLEKQLRVGVAVEMEHTNSEAKAEEIAMDHLAEDPRYYTKLVRKGFVDEPKALKIHKEIYEGDWFDNLSYHPANQPEDPDPTREIEYTPAQQKFSTMAFMGDGLGFTLLHGKDPIGGVWVLNVDDMPGDYLLTTDYTDEDGYGDVERELDDEACLNYATDLWDDQNREPDNVGEGMEGYEDGKLLCRVDAELAEDLIRSMERKLRPGSLSPNKPAENADVRKAISLAVYELNKLFSL
jgi:hypothetical protein